MTRVFLVALLGGILLLHPLYLFPHYNQTSYQVAEVREVENGAFDDGKVIEYDSLSPEAKKAFDAGRRSDTYNLWTGEDDRAIRMLRENQYIRYQEQHHQYSLRHMDSAPPFLGVARGLLTAIGSTLVVLSGLMWQSDGEKPIAPVRSLYIPVGITTGIIAMHSYDVLFSGAGGALPLPNSLVDFVPVFSVYATAGSIIKRYGTEYVPHLTGIGLIALSGGAIVADTPFVVPLLLGVVSVFGGAPWAVLGYRLTASRRT